MAALEATQVFNNSDRLVEGWYWAMRSSELRRKQARPLSFLGRELVVFRGESGEVRVMDAYCPHMGAHLAEGKVEGEGIRCLFHHWKFDQRGACVDIPCQKQTDFVRPVRTWPAAEKYGLIWIWTGAEPRQPIPHVPELAGPDIDFRLGNRFVKDCHPNVMMINAIDAQHFNSVHQLPVDLNLEPRVENDNWIVFRNTTRVPSTSALTRFIGRFYDGALTYVLGYWFGSTGSVTIGPDFLHFHIIFALRPTRDGRSEGQTILVTKKRDGALGRLANRGLLFLTAVVGNYFAKGDTLIFKTIRFNFQTPIKADYPIIRFVQHVETQRTTAWGFEPARSAPEAIPSLFVASPKEVEA